MPLSEAEREVLTREANSGQLPKPAQWLGWTEALYRLWLQRGRIGRWIVVGFLLSLFVGWRYPKFESTVQIMPPDAGSSSGLAALIPALTKSPGLAGLAGDLTGAKTSGAVFTKVLGSRTVLDDLIKRFDLQKHYGLKYWEDTRQKLGSRTDIVEDKKSGVIAITVHDRDPGLAMDLANAYVDELSLVTAKVSTSAAKQERIFIEQRLSEETKNLQNAEQQFSQFASANMALDVPEQMKATVEAAGRLQGEVIAARAQLDALKQTYTDENIRVKSAQAHVDELERALVRINSGQQTQGVKDASNPYPSVKSLPLLGVKWTDLYRNTKIRETVVELLTQQYEMARIQEAKEATTVKVLDSASTPEHKRPSWLLLTLAGTAFFTFLACAGYLLKDWWDRWDQDDPRRILIAQIMRDGPGRLMYRRRTAKTDQMSQL
ncbi:MAG TPA: lipopolysaccharide biosynthesis protein [Candidatus Angelobacter sp.]|nr:lipopolysaccharide biosynthesis protein [Candidatus Angelobacter sp.]